MLDSVSPLRAGSVASSITAARLQRAQERSRQIQTAPPPPSERVMARPHHSVGSSAPKSSTAPEELVLNGYARHPYENGDVYEGEWKDDQRDGRGKLIYASGALYEGQFKADKKDGEGTYSHASGDSYTGEWRAGKYHGQGVFTTASGEIMIARYEQGAPVGDGTMLSTDGQLAVRLENGAAVEEISLEEARRIAEEVVGLPSSKVPLPLSS